MVDEFQDTNPRQLAILRSLERENLFTVEQRVVLRQIGRLPSRTMARVDACLRAALDLK